MTAQAHPRRTRGLRPRHTRAIAGGVVVALGVGVGVACSAPMTSEPTEMTALPVTSAPAMQALAVTMHHNDAMRSGVNSQETQLTPSNVSPTRFALQRQATVDGRVYTEP